MKQITNKDLLYSTGNYTQYFVINYKGKDPEKGKKTLKKKTLKKKIHTCTYKMNHFAVPETITAL